MKESKKIAKETSDSCNIFLVLIYEKLEEYKNKLMKIKSNLKTKINFFLPELDFNLEKEIISI